MEYKVLVKIIVPEIEDSYEVYIPVNKTIGEISGLLNRLINSLSGGVYPIKEILGFYNRRTGAPYLSNLLIRNTDIRNGSELVVIS